MTMTMTMVMAIAMAIAIAMAMAMATGCLFFVPILGCGQWPPFGKTMSGESNATKSIRLLLYVGSILL